MRYSLVDKLLINADQALRTLVPQSVHPRRPSPAVGLDSQAMDSAQEKHAAGLMRINHCGEVCAQALYQGQALTARDQHVQQAMQDSALEEEDHLAWCEERLQQLHSHTSLLNPFWYGASFTLGAIAGAIGDKVSLGFVAATEDQVCEHLHRHLEELPFEDNKSRAIIRQMLVDEAQHADKALAAGGMEFPEPVKKAMTLVSHAMTRSTYHL